MKSTALTATNHQPVLDASTRMIKGDRDVTRRERLIEEQEDAEDRAAFEAALPAALKELKAGECVDLDTYLAARKTT